ESAGLEANIQPLKTRTGPDDSPGFVSSIWRKAELSGVSSGGRFLQARTVIVSVPNFTGRSSGASNFEIRAVVLSRPCSTASSARAGRATSASDAPRIIARVLIFGRDWRGGRRGRGARGAAAPRRSP